MPDPVTGIAAGATLITGYLSSKAAKDAAEAAAGAQTQASEAGIAETQRQFDAMQELLQPYTEAGVGALGAQEALTGLQGPEAERDAIAAIEGSPMFEALSRTGEEAILQQASATGGLRGGNVQGALAQFRPALLNQLINERYARLSGITRMGQASAAGVGAAGMETGRNVSVLLGERGAAQAGEALARGAADVDLWGDIGKTVTTIAGGF